MEERKLVKKLAEVMKEVKYIQKTGYNSFHKYKYATEADVNEKVREELSARDVIMIPNVRSQSSRTHTTAKGNTEYIVTVEVEFTFYDGETGESIVFTTFGEGQDAGDKGTYKAITGAQKYALMKAFMIPTGDDPEADSGVDERNAGNTQQHRPQVVSEQKSELSVLKAKWQALAGDLIGFDDWYNGQKEKGYGEAQMNAYLTKKLSEKKGA